MYKNVIKYTSYGESDGSGTNKAINSTSCLAIHVCHELDISENAIMHDLIDITHGELDCIDM